ncbi:MAG: hypothetical protein ACLFQJ_08370, partial [Campylobacterales bacterium]
ELVVDGKSDIASSSTTYDITVKNKQPAKAVVSIKDLKLEELLALLGKPAYASAIVNLESDIDILAAENMSGYANININKGTISQSIMKRDFNVTIPATTFTSDAEIKLNGDRALIDYNLLSNLAKVYIKGSALPFSSYIDLDYNIDVEKLEAFKPITNAPLRGALSLKGKAVGDDKSMDITSSGILAKGDKNIKANLKEFKPASLDATIKDLDIAALLYMVEQPHYSDGKIDIDAKLSSLEMGKLAGTIKTDIKSGSVDRDVLQKQFEFEHRPPVITYKGHVDTTLSGDEVISKVDVDSNIANLQTKKSVFKISNGSIKSDYRALIKDFGALYFAIGHKLRGSSTIIGDIDKNPTNTKVTAHTKMLDGVMDFKLDQNKLNATITDVETLKLLHMAYYPEVFTSKINLNLNYNVETKKGELYNKLDQGRYVQNHMTELIAKFTGFDLTKQMLKYNLRTNIDGENTVTKLDMDSNNAKINTDSAKLNTETKAIDIPLDLEILGNKLSFRIHGTTNNPKYDFDFGKIIQDRAKEEGKKAIQKELDKQLGDGAGEKAKELLKGLF